MMKRSLVVLGAWFSLSVFAAGEPVALSGLSPHCGWTVAHFNLFKPAAVVAAWKNTNFLKKVAKAESLDELSQVLAETPAEYQFEMSEARALLKSVQGVSMNFPVLTYASNIPTRQGYESRNPLDSRSMVQLIAAISLRGVKTFKRSLFRSRESILFFQNAGYDAITYEITHLDGSRSDILCYLVSKKDWFAPFGFDEAKNRTVVGYVVVSNGLEVAETYAGLEHGRVIEGPWPADTPQQSARRDEVRAFAETFTERGDIFPVAEEALGDPIQSVN